MNMSDLQISLIVVGILIIGCVVFYNWIQRRRYERNTEKAFKNKYDDVLLETEEVKEVEEFEPIRSRVEPTIVKSDGLITSKVSPLSESTHSPLIKHCCLKKP